MKNLSYLLFLCIMILSCNIQKKPLETLKKTNKINNNFFIEYTAISRGVFKKITIENQTISLINGRSEFQKSISEKISDADQTQLQTFLDEINLDKIAEFESPSQKRFYDGAPIANLKIVVSQKAYESQSFDHGTPPLELKKLVDKILILINNK